MGGGVWATQHASPFGQKKTLTNDTEREREKEKESGRVEKKRNFHNKVNVKGSA